VSPVRSSFTAAGAYRLRARNFDGLSKRTRRRSIRLRRIKTAALCSLVLPLSAVTAANSTSSRALTRRKSSSVGDLLSAMGCGLALTCHSFDSGFPARCRPAGKPSAQPVVSGLELRAKCLRYHQLVDKMYG